MMGTTEQHWKNAVRWAAVAGFFAGLSVGLTLPTIFGPTEADARPVESPHNIALASATVSSDEVLVLGDSTCARPMDSGFLPAEWRTDCVRGRQVTVLPGRLALQIQNNGMPKVLVIALGTNGDPNWTRADYVAAVDQLWLTREVVFVTPFRDADIYGQASYERMRQYAWWMRDICDDLNAVRPGRCAISQWRQFAENHPERLVDGVHEDFPLGEQEWSNRVKGAVDSVS